MCSLSTSTAEFHKSDDVGRHAEEDSDATPPASSGNPVRQSIKSMY